MNSWKKLMVVTGVIALCLSANSLMAQGNGGGGNGGRGGRGGRGGGNFDPAQFRQQQMDRLKEDLEVTDDGEWKVLEGAITKVMDANQDVMASVPRGFGRGGRGGGGGGGATAGGGTNTDTQATTQGGNNRRQRGGGTASPEVEALQAAIDVKAPADEIKGKLGKVRDALQAKQAKLTSAQVDLQKLVSARQEAILVLRGILK